MKHIVIGISQKHQSEWKYINILQEVLKQQRNQNNLLKDRKVA